MNATGNETLDRIQQEIKESLRREEEHRKEYVKVTNNSESTQNGYVNNNQTSPPMSPIPVMTNDTAAPKPPVLTNGNATSNFRRFTPNPSARGVMEKFLKMRGKVNVAPIKLNNQPSIPVWKNDDVFEPAKVTVEPGKHVRNGYVSAEEKMRRELLEFQQREAELRKERKKSQPDLMAALETEPNVYSNLKPARSMGQMYSTEDLTEETYSAPASLKPARSLAELCDFSDEEVETPGTHLLIMQFENLKNQARA